MGGMATSISRMIMKRIMMKTKTSTTRTTGLLPVIVNTREKKTMTRIMMRTMTKTKKRITISLTPAMKKRKTRMKRNMAAATAGKTKWIMTGGTTTGDKDRGRDAVQKAAGAAMIMNPTAAAAHPVAEEGLPPWTATR